MYGGLGAQYGGLGATAGQQAGMYGQMGAQAGRQGMRYGAEAGQAGAEYARQATDPGAMQAYMSPYMQNVVQTQQREAQRASDILGAQQRGQATQAGAFGGGRQAIMEAERQRNLATQMGGIQAAGLQNAYQQAQQAQQFGSTLGLQGRQAAIQGAGLGIQGAQTGIQGQQAGIQGAQAGMQGAQVGLQGVGAQQAGYGQAIQGAGQLGNLGTQQLAAQQGVLGTQAQYGAQQQAYNQNILNQAIQNYAMQQQYPQQQLAFMNAQLRGLPMQASTTQSYQAPPSYLSQAAGLGMAGYGLSKLMGKKGGLPKDFEKKKDDAPGGLQALALSKM